MLYVTLPPPVLPSRVGSDEAAPPAVRVVLVYDKLGVIGVHATEMVWLTCTSHPVPLLMLHQYVPASATPHEAFVNVAPEVDDACTGVVAEAVAHSTPLYQV